MAKNTTITIDQDLYNEFKQHCAKEGYIIKYRLAIVLREYLGCPSEDEPTNNIEAIKKYIKDKNFPSLTDEGLARIYYWSVGVHNSKTIKEYTATLIRDGFLELKDDDIYYVMGV